MHSSSEVEHPDPYILVVGNRTDGLDDEMARTGHCGRVRAVVGMFPEDTIIDFVHTDHIPHDLCRTVRRNDIAVDILDQA